MLAIKNVLLIDGTGRQPVPNAVILIEDGKIFDVGVHIKIPEGADQINADGLTAMPALSDAHTHFSGSSLLTRPPLGKREQTYDYAEAREAYLRWGVLTVRTAGDMMPDIIEYKEDVLSGKIVSPRVIAAGPMFQARGGHPLNTVFMSETDVEKDACILIDDETDIEAAVEAVADRGVDWIKTFYAHINKMNYPVPAPRMSRKNLERLITAAHKKGKPVMVHVDGPEEMLVAAMCGADSIEHMIGVGAEDTEFSEKLIELLKSRDIAVVPTLLSIQRYDDKVEGATPIWETLKAATKKLWDMGITLAVGTDSGIPLIPHGESLHDELACLVEAGLSPMQAICAGSLGNAKLLGTADKTGSLERGKLADIILLGSNPLENITNTKDIKRVFMEGRIVYDS